MKREKLREIARQAMEEIAQEARFRPEDHQVLLKHKDRLLAPTFAKVPLRAGEGPGRARSGGRPAWSCGGSPGIPA
jgi:hypothetical protein